VVKPKEDSDEDDTEWIPGCEEVNRRRKSGHCVYCIVGICNTYQYDSISKQ